MHDNTAVLYVSLEAPPITRLPMTPQTGWSMSATSPFSVFLYRQQQTCKKTCLILSRPYKTLHNAPSILINSSPAAHLLLMQTPRATSNVSVTLQLYKCPHRRQQTHMLLQVILFKLYIPPAVPQVHLEKAHHVPPAQDARTPNNIKPANRSTSHSLIRSPTANARAQSTRSAHTLHGASCFSTKPLYSPRLTRSAHNVLRREQIGCTVCTTNAIKPVFYLAPLHLPPSPVSNSPAYSAPPPHTRHHVSHFSNIKRTQPTLEIQHLSRGQSEKTPI